MFRDNLAKVNIFFPDPYYVKIEREVRITEITFLGEYFTFWSSAYSSMFR